MTAPTWDNWQYLLGEWHGHGGGQPGQGESIMTFRFDLQKQVLVRNNHMDYPATPERPGFTHDDLTIIYPDEAGTVRAVYFDNEGHTIHYGVTTGEQEVIFVSDLVPGAPRFRFTYLRGDQDTVITRFEIAPPGNPDGFTVYVEGKVKRAP